MFTFNGHPIYDIGVATITVFARKRDPAHLTPADVEAVATYMAEQYVQYPLKSFLTVVFPNSGFTQVAFEKEPERRIAYAQQVLRSYGEEEDTLAEQCVFTGEPATAVIFKDKQEGMLPGRAFRQHIPMLTGEGVINFHPYGDAGLPISGKAMVAIQAFPLGCAKSGGRLFGVHSDNPNVLLHFAREFLEMNRRNIQIAQQKGTLEERKKMPDAEYEHRTLLIKTLLEARVMQQDAHDEDANFSITAYHLSNSGQGPGLTIYHLPLPVIGFLRDMMNAPYHTQWLAIVRRAWQLPPKPKKGSEDKPVSDFRPRYNRLYEDLLALPEGAKLFIRTYFLRLALRMAKSADDPRRTYSLQQEIDLVSWEITSRFLRKVVAMDAERIERIKTLGDKLAAYIKRNNAKAFFRTFFKEQKYPIFRTWLIRALRDEVKDSGKLLFTMEDFLLVFEEAEDYARSDWWFARDLMLIRMVEQLTDWLHQNPDAIPEDEPDSESDT